MMSDLRATPISTLSLAHFEVFVRDRLLIHARGVQRGFIDQVREVCAGESRRASRDHGDIDIFSQWNLSDMNREDAFAAFDVRPGNDNAPIKTAGSQQCRIQNIGPVRRGNQR